MSYSHVEHDRSLRVAIRFEGDDLVLKAITETRTRPAPHEAIDEPTDFWFELRDDDENVIYSATGLNPFTRGAEHFGPGHATPHREPASSGWFNVLVPSIDGTTLWIFGVTPGNPEPHAVAGFDLRQAQPALV